MAASRQDRKRVGDELFCVATASLHAGFLRELNPQLALVLLTSMPSGCPDVAQARESILQNCPGPPLKLNVAQFASRFVDVVT